MLDTRGGDNAGGVVRKRLEIPTLSQYIANIGTGKNISIATNNVQAMVSNAGTGRNVVDVATSQPVRNFTNSPITKKVAQVYSTTPVIKQFWNIGYGAGDAVTDVAMKKSNAVDTGKGWYPGKTVNDLLTGGSSKKEAAKDDGGDGAGWYPGKYLFGNGVGDGGLFSGLNFPDITLPSFSPSVTLPTIAPALTLPSLNINGGGGMGEAGQAFASTLVPIALIGGLALVGASYMKNRGA